MNLVKKRILSLESVNSQIKLMEYAIRGPLFIRAGEIEEELEKGIKKPFAEVIKANNGDCHAMGQKPISFIRQIMALVSYPNLFSDAQIPDDIKEKAKIILKGCRGGSIGAYTESAGLKVIRKHVAEYIQKRDAIPSDWENIILTNGTSDGIKTLLKLFINNTNKNKSGIMIPVPQYPIYSATLTEYNLYQIGYFLDESRCWGLDVAELQRAITKSRDKCVPKVIVVINPGNPTGQVLTRKNIEEVIKFAYEENLLIFADEVYQDNIYTINDKFHSFKKVLAEMDEPYNQIELVSFMSCSKGYMGECGVRGGYIELTNVHPEIKALYLKTVSSVCPNIMGQVAVDCVVNPPVKGEPSYSLYIKEKQQILDALKLRAKMVEETFNSIEGITCNLVEGAMYAFPQITLPKKALEAAENKHQAADEFFAFELLENTGICLIPGSGFGQREGTFHFRTTILPEIAKLKIMLEKFKDFYEHFQQKYK